MFYGPYDIICAVFHRMVLEGTIPARLYQQQELVFERSYFCWILQTDVVLIPGKWRIGAYAGSLKRVAHVAQL